MLRLRPGMVTFAGLLFSAAVPVPVVFGGAWLFLAAGLVFLAALADSADGALAVLTERASRVGSFYDSMADRLAEVGWLVGLWLIGVPAALVVATGALAWLHEYARARAGAVGMRGVGVITMAERPTRVMIAIAAFAVGGGVWYVDPHLTPGAATVLVAAWLVLGLLGLSRLVGAIRDDLARTDLLGDDLRGQSHHGQSSTRMG
ncbi:MAG TPA: CDP-alcohol phosphatidyltransferase family protein [Micromonosporaceae bacterium]